MNIFNLKVWEVLLAVAVLLLGAIAYESHKSNAYAPGRYVEVVYDLDNRAVMDTGTGALFEWDKDSSEWKQRIPAVSRDWDISAEKK